MTRKILVVSNTHWDREFKQSFEKTRFDLLKMLDITLDILDKDECYHSFTMDGHSIMIEDYLEMRPEKEELVKKLVINGKLIIGPYYTLAEQFSISDEALVRNLLFGRKTVEKYGGKVGTVAYTPSSWGQTGQYPQILKDFGLDKMMFYRGISHDETQSEYLWQAPDGTKIYASRFALYCRYNFYYQVHRGVTKNRTFAKDYIFGEFDETPYRSADGKIEGLSYDLKNPKMSYDSKNLKKYINDMLKEEDGHFKTSVFLAMNGHDISCAFPLESSIIKEAQKQFEGEIEIEHTDLEHYWNEVLKELDLNDMTTLVGERRSYLRKGKWTFLFPSTISARTYLKQMEFNAYNNLVYSGEMLSSMAVMLGGDYLDNYIQRGWKYLLTNHTHDANGGCAPDPVCEDMKYRYRKVNDISDILSNNSMVYIAKNLDTSAYDKSSMFLIVYNTTPYSKDSIIKVDLELPSPNGETFSIDSCNIQVLSSETSSTFVDSIWDVPTIMNTFNHKAYIEFKDIPAMGYKVFEIKPGNNKTTSCKSLIKQSNLMENEFLAVHINENGTVNVLDKANQKQYNNLNYFTSNGEIGNAWKHTEPENDKTFDSLGVKATITVLESGELCSTILAEFSYFVPSECNITQSDKLVEIPIAVTYKLYKGSSNLQVNVRVCNSACDHLFKANFPTGIISEFSIADSHFDIVKRKIAIPNSNGWAEKAYGTHPLRTFVALNDEQHTFAVMPKGLFEYEAFEDGRIALTLIRGCRIKLAVSEEKMTELDDKGVECLGEGTFEYALDFGGACYDSLINKACDYYNEVKSAVVGRSNGKLPFEASMVSIDNKKIHISAIKKAEDSKDIIIRMFNPCQSTQTVTVNLGVVSKSVYLCKMDESIIAELAGNVLQIPKKKIVSLRVKL